ncbi:MAG: hypothetical protein MRK02_08045 [Candidatus Scalindua sp.]|nr:hypothetical protein [Candidatus Scalindua sp.]
MKKKLPVIILGFSMFTFLISISLQWESSLNNWNRNFPLLLGNERTGNRPWQGYVSELFIADKAISETEVEQVFFKNNTFDIIGESLIASYQFSGTESYHDEMENSPDLVWRGEPQDIQQRDGVLLGHNNWLETEAPAEYLTRRIVATSQFTIGTVVATGDTIQAGPARIISLSEDISHRNFTLGQSGSDLIFRLRTPFSEENGAKLSLIVPDIFSTINPHNLIITYDGLTLLLYVDGKLSSYSLELNPGTILFSSLFRQITYCVTGFKAIHYVYYALIFVPLGILMALAVKKIRKQSLIQIITISISVLLPSIIFEGVLVSVSGRAVRVENLLTSMIFTIIPMVFLRYIIPRIL